MSTITPSDAFNAIVLLLLKTQCLEVPGPEGKLLGQQYSKCPIKL